MKAFVDYRINPKSAETLRSIGYEVVKTHQSKKLYNAVCGHADMQLCKIRDNLAVAAPGTYEYLEKSVFEAKIYPGLTEIGGMYPWDIAYNAACVGNRLFCNEKYTDGEILRICRENGIDIVDVRQGYAKCSICIVNDNAIITSDSGVAKTAEKCGLDVLIVDDGNVALEDFEHGFIGGATGLLKPGLLAVNGNIERHASCNAVIDFCARNRTEIVCLNKDEITDVGSIITLD